MNTDEELIKPGLERLLKTMVLTVEDYAEAYTDKYPDGEDNPYFCASITIIASAALTLVRNGLKEELTDKQIKEATSAFMNKVTDMVVHGHNARVIKNR